ncbi:MAG: STAS domain-containing protein [Actinomycetota bacterium]|nr:STAS domain-containing protein [Actinomycetota bacterium]
MIGEKWSETAPCPAGALTITAVLSRPQPDTTVCTVTGTLNTDTAPVLRDALVEARRDDNAHLVIDLSTITSMDMDSAGLYTLLEACFKHEINGGGHLAIVVDSHTQSVPELYVVALEVTSDLHHNLVDALHACADADASNAQRGNKGKAPIEPALVRPTRAQLTAARVSTDEGMVAQSS